MRTKQVFAKRRAAFFWYPIFVIFLVTFVQNSGSIVIIQKMIRQVICSVVDSKNLVVICGIRGCYGLGSRQPKARYGQPAGSAAHPAQKQVIRARIFERKREVPQNPGAGRSAGNSRKRPEYGPQIPENLPLSSGRFSKKSGSRAEDFEKCVTWLLKISKKERDPFRATNSQPTNNQHFSLTESAILESLFPKKERVMS